MIVYRRSRIPAIYAELPFVRKWAPSILADCPDDLRWLNEIKDVASGKQCVSSLESPHVILVKCDFPDSILERCGATGEGISWHRYGWKTYDVQYLFRLNMQPAEAVPLDDADIDPHLLATLAERSSCVPLLHATEELFDEGGRKGYTFSKEDEERILAVEKQLFAAFDLQALKHSSDHAAQRGPPRTSPRCIPLRLRERILRRDQYRCIFCGRRADDARLEINHILPKSLIKRLHLGKELYVDERNLCVTCFECNRGKSDNLRIEDTEFYIKAFSAASHPNHGILKYLYTIRELQIVGRRTDVE